MITPSEFLQLTAQPGQPFRLRMATIDPAYVSGNPRVIFDGEAVLTTARYPFLGGAVGAGWRVVMAPVGTSWVVLGGIGEGSSGGGGGDNNFAGDVFITDGQLESQRDLGTESTLVARVGAEATGRFQLRADGQMFWGSGSATRDTNLYRSTANELRTDDTFVAGTDLRVGGTATVGGERVLTRNMLQTFEAASSASITMTTSFQDLTGAAISFTTHYPNVVVQTTAVYFVNVTAVGATDSNNLQGTIMVDSVDQTADGDARLSMASTMPVPFRIMFSQVFSTTLATAGNHNIRLRARKTVNEGVAAMSSGQCKLIATVYDMP